MAIDNDELMQIAAARVEGGRIVEDGTYDELIGRGGPFSELVERQRLDV